MSSEQTIARIEALMARTGWSALQTSRYLGVPHNTLGSWLNGHRKPNRVVGRLLDVLGQIEAMAPGIHDTMIPKKGVTP